MMVSFIDEHREKYGVEPICSQLPIAPSTFYDHQLKQRDPERELLSKVVFLHLN